MRRVASIQMTSTDQVDENLQMAGKLIQDAAADGAGLIVLPEMFATMGMDEVHKIHNREKPGSGPIQDFLREQAIKHDVWLVGGTIPMEAQDHHEKARAACMVFNNQGEQVARYDKVHLFDVHVPSSQEAYSESRVIEPGDKIVVIPTPFGRLGLAVCYDVRFPEMFRRMHAQDVEIIALPAAFTYTTGAAHWEVLVRSRAIENLCYVVAACQTGTHVNGRRTYGHSMMVNPWGEVKAVLEQGVGFIAAEINLDYMRQVRMDFPVLTHRKL